MVTRNESEHVFQHSSEWGVGRRDCGHFTLTLGALALNLSPDEFNSLLRMLQRAAVHFGVQGSPAVEQAPVTH